jgi:hypothetical protein
MQCVVVDCSARPTNPLRRSNKVKDALPVLLRRHANIALVVLFIDNFLQHSEDAATQESVVKVQTRACHTASITEHSHGRLHRSDLDIV